MLLGLALITRDGEFFLSTIGLMLRLFERDMLLEDSLFSGLELRLLLKLPLILLVPLLRLLLCPLVQSTSCVIKWSKRFISSWKLHFGCLCSHPLLFLRFSIDLTYLHRLSFISSFDVHSKFTVLYC